METSIWKMKIKILAFGIAREICGTQSFELEVPEHSDTAALKQLLNEQYPRLNQLTSCILAVNEEYVVEYKMLSPGDEVAIIPPVSGG